MFQQWTFSHPTTPSDKRAERHHGELRVALTIPFESWQLLWTLPSLNISKTGILCAMKVSDQASAQRASDLDSLLDAQPEVQLQIDVLSHELFAPSVGARLVRKTKQHWGLELAFQFLSEENDDLTSLIGSLMHPNQSPVDQRH